MNNNYLKVLLYLKQFEGDGKFHEIESVLGDEIDSESKTSIFQELATEGFIHLEGGAISGLPLYAFSFGNGKIDYCGGREKIEYIPFSGKLQFKGSKYLKEEMEMIDKNKYNINIHNSTANLIIESAHATINNKSEVVDKARSIINTIENDNSIDASNKQKAIGTVNDFIKEVEQGKPSKGIIQKMMTMGAEVSSIGSLVLSLIQMLAAH